MGRVAIRLNAVVSLAGGLQNRLLLPSIFYLTLLNWQLQTRRLRHLTGHGAGVAGIINLAFARLYQHNQSQLVEGTMPFSSQKI